jgi:subtilisin family serine protease
MTLLEELRPSEVLGLPVPPLPVRLWQESGRARLDLLIRLEDGELAQQEVVLGQFMQLGLRYTTWTGPTIIGSADVADLPRLVENDLEALVDAAPVVRPALDVSVPEAWHVPASNPMPAAAGGGVIIGVVDSGIDLAHPSFLHVDGTTRVHRYWNQSADGIGVAPAWYGYGSESDAKAIDAQLPSVPTAWLDPTGHGTLVAGVAAGNGLASPAGRYVGVAPEADLIVVAIEARQGSFASSDNVIDGIEYVFGEASALGRRAVVNVSQGVQIGAHVPTDGLETSLTRVLARDDNRIVVVSSGNTGVLDAHARVDVPTAGTADVIVDVPRWTGPWVAIDMWYDIADGIDVELIDPTGSRTPVVDGRTSKVGQVGAAETYDVRGIPNVRGVRASRIQVKLLTRTHVGHVTAGRWTLRIHGRSMVRGAPVDIWLERGALMASPRFDPGQADADCTITSPATADGAIAVSSYAVRPVAGPFADSSGRGPDRVGGAVSMLAAPGETITTTAPSNIAATSYSVSQGTSLAAAHVTGAIALMLEANPALTRSDVHDCLITTARHDADTVGGPASGWGAGKLDINAALACATDK